MSDLGAPTSRSWRFAGSERSKKGTPSARSSHRPSHVAKTAMSSSSRKRSSRRPRGGSSRSTPPTMTKSQAGACGERSGAGPSPPRGSRHHRDRARIHLCQLRGRSLECRETATAVLLPRDVPIARRDASAACDIGTRRARRGRGDHLDTFGRPWQERAHRHVDDRIGRGGGCRGSPPGRSTPTVATLARDSRSTRRRRARRCGRARHGQGRGNPRRGPYRGVGGVGPAPGNPRSAPRSSAHRW